MNTINGQPLITRARNGLICVKQRGIDVEDFAETMRWAKSKGLIQDGPIIERTPPRRYQEKRMIEASCTVCGGKFYKLFNSRCKGCGPACSAKLRSASAFAKYKRMRELNGDGKSN
jgi:hypothetical protein